MSTTFEKRVAYERLQNGMDVYALRASSPDVVVAQLAFPGGDYATYDRPIIASLLDLMLPGSTKTQPRNELHESLDRLGAQVSVHSDDTHLILSLSCRSAVFREVLRIAVDVLTQCTLPAKEFTEAAAHLRSSLVQARESTKVRAKEVLLHQLYRKGHPHWSPDLRSLSSELAQVSRADVAAFYRRTFSATGSVACVVGDIDPSTTLTVIHEVCASLPISVPAISPQIHVDRVVETVEHADLIVSMRDKINVDTYLGIPTLLTRENDAYHALSIGVQILGASSNSRLFNELRTRQSLTYGAYASFAGYADGYPGYLLANAIFPHDVFGRALASFREVVRTFIDKGVTSKELTSRKEEVRGRHVIGLSTTTGLSSALTSTILTGRPVGYLDTYLDCIDALTAREVNAAITTYLPYDRTVTVAAGAVDQEGKPLV